MADKKLTAAQMAIMEFAVKYNHSSGWFRFTKFTLDDPRYMLEGSASAATALTKRGFLLTRSASRMVGGMNEYQITKAGREYMEALKASEQPATTDSAATEETSAPTEARKFRVDDGAYVGDDLVEVTRVLPDNRYYVRYIHADKRAVVNGDDMTPLADYTEEQNATYTEARQEIKHTDSAATPNTQDTGQPEASAPESAGDIAPEVVYQIADSEGTLTHYRDYPPVVTGDECKTFIETVAKSFGVNLPDSPLRVIMQICESRLTDTERLQAENEALRAQNEAMRADNVRQRTLVETLLNELSGLKDLMQFQHDEKDKLQERVAALEALEESVRSFVDSVPAEQPEFDTTYDPYHAASALSKWALALKFRIVLGLSTNA